MTPCCPRCREIVLQPMSAHGVAVMVCGRCWGLWIDHDAATRIAHAALDGATGVAPEHLACPMCQRALGAWHARGVTIDRCDTHGLWFDHAELDHLVAIARERHAGDGAFGTGAAVAVGAVAAGVAATTAAAEPRVVQPDSRADVAATVVDAVDIALPVAEASGSIVGALGDAVGAIFDFFN